MNREQRLRRELSGTGLEDRAPELAALPAAQVELIAEIARVSRRKGREIETEMRARRREARAGSLDIDQIGAGARRLVGRVGTRASVGDVEALAQLAAAAGAVEQAARAAVAGCRARGLTDLEIGVALGYKANSARQSVAHRFGRRDRDVPAGSRTSLPSSQAATGT